jgi:hypothetical protein
MVQTRSGFPSSPLGANTPASPETPFSETTFSFLGPALFIMVDKPSLHTEYTEQTVNVEEQKEAEHYDVDEQEEPEQWEKHEETDLTNPYEDVTPNESYYQLLDVMGINRKEHLLHAIHVSSEPILIYVMFRLLQVLYDLMESRLLHNFANNESIMIKLIT